VSCPLLVAADEEGSGAPMGVHCPIILPCLLEHRCSRAGSAGIRAGRSGEVPSLAGQLLDRWVGRTWLWTPRDFIALLAGDSAGSAGLAARGGEVPQIVGQLLDR
jgi:hypothetical protein